jgi:hypothetical protein
MRQRVETEIDAILKPYFDALHGAVLHAVHEGRVIVSEHPELAARIAAAEKLLDRVHGRPSQQLEVSGNETARRSSCCTSASKKRAAPPLTRPPPRFEWRSAAASRPGRSYEVGELT